MTKNQAVLEIAADAGELLLKNGAEIFRVQDTVIYILQAFGVPHCSIYVVANGLFITLGETETENCFAVRSVPHTSIHLGRIAAVNALSREIQQMKNPNPAEIKKRLKECAQVPYFPFSLQLLASGIGCGGFCYLLEGTLFDSMASFFSGMLLQCFLKIYQNSHSRFMPTILGSGLVTLLAGIFSVIFPVLRLNHMIIGSIILLVPGVAFTTSIRDFFNGDYLSGNIHMTEALLTGVCIAIGVSSALYFWSALTGGSLI